MQVRRATAVLAEGLDDSSSHRWWDIGCIAVMAAICATRAAYHGLPVLIHANDNMIALDGGWRVLSGQRPHVDFYSALGPISSMITAFGLALDHHAVQGINYGSAILGFLIGLWSFLIARSRMASPWAALTGIFFALLIVAPAPLGDPYYTITEAMFYNRYGYALLALILIEAYLPLREGHRTPVAGGLSSGAACGLLLFLKASYFLIAAPMIAVMLLMRRQDKARIAGILLGFGGALTVMLAYLGFHAGAMVHDLRIAAGARAGELHSDNLLVKVRATLIPNLSLLALATLFGYAADTTTEDWRGRILASGRRVLAALLVVGTGVAVLVSNYQSGATPLNGLFAIMLADTAMRNAGAGKGRVNDFRLSSYVLIAVWALCLSVPLMTSEGRSLVYGLQESHVPADSPKVNLIHSGVTSELKLMGISPTIPSKYADPVNDGIVLLQRWSPAAETVFSLNVCNPFSYVLQRKPALGGSTWLDPNRNFSDTWKPSPEWLLGHADVAMVMKSPGFFEVDYILHNYMGYLSAHFHLVAESKFWWLYRKNGR
jgi:hypothetical protein